MVSGFFMVEIGNRGQTPIAKGFLKAELDISPELWFFKCHFLDDPIMPGSLGIDALWQALGFYLCWKGFHGKGRALGVEKIKFKKQILPSASMVSFLIDIKKIHVNQRVIAFADGKVLVDGQKAFTAHSLQVGFL